MNKCEKRERMRKKEKCICYSGGVAVWICDCDFFFSMAIEGRKEKKTNNTNVFSFLLFVWQCVSCDATSADTLELYFFSAL